MEILRILWGAISATPIVFAVVMVIARPHDVAPQPPFLPYALGAASLFMLGFSFVFPRTMLTRAIRALKLEQRTEVSKEETLFRDAAPTYQVFVEPFEHVFKKVLPHFQTSMILAIALGEAICLNGFVLGFTGFDLAVAVPFFAVGWISMLVRFPRTAPIRRRIEAIHGATFAR